MYCTQWFCLSRNIGQVSLKIIYFRYICNKNLDESIRKIFDSILKTEALIIVSISRTNLDVFSIQLHWPSVPDLSSDHSPKYGERMSLRQLLSNMYDCLTRDCDLTRITQEQPVMNSSPESSAQKQKKTVWLNSVLVENLMTDLQTQQSGTMFTRVNWCEKHSNQKRH